MVSSRRRPLTSSWKSIYDKWGKIKLITLQNTVITIVAWKELKAFIIPPGITYILYCPRRLTRGNGNVYNFRSSLASSRGTRTSTRLQECYCGWLWRFSLALHLVDCDTRLRRCGMESRRKRLEAGKCFNAWLLDGLSAIWGSSKAFSSVRSTGLDLPRGPSSLDWHGPSPSLSLFSLFSLLFPRLRLSLF